MQSFWEKIKRQDAVQWVSAVIVLCSFLYPVLQSITLAPLKSDATLNLYIAQRLAAGEAPYSGYFIMHPPISHFIGALAVFLGRLFSIQPVIATRLLALLLSILIIGVTYLIAREVVKGGELLAIWAVSSNVLMLMVIWGFYEKLVMVLFLCLAIYMIQKGREFASGIFFGLVLMTWGGSIILLPVFLFIFIFRPEISRKKFLLAVGVVFAVVFASLALSGSFVHFFQQYFITVFEYAINKLISVGVRDSEFGVSNITANTNLSAIDYLAVLGGGVSFFAFLLLKKKDEWFEKSSIGILLLTLIYGIFILIDYQSPFDLIILFPALSILFAWGVLKLMGYWVKMWHVFYQPTYLLVLLLVFSLVRVYSFQRIPNRLYAQKEAAARLQTLIEENEVVFLGDLSPLVLMEGKNPTPAIHMGPKSFLAMRNQGYPLYAYMAALDSQSPALILADQRNLEYQHLAPFYIWLEDHYLFLGDTRNPTINVYINREAEDAILPALAFIFNHNPGSYVVEDMNLVEKPEIVSSFIPINNQIILIDHKIADVVQLYWWTPPPRGVNGGIVYRFVMENGEDTAPWTYLEQQWDAGQILVTDLPFAGYLNNVSEIEFCISMDDAFIETCAGKQVYLLKFFAENS